MWVYDSSVGKQSKIRGDSVSNSDGSTEGKGAIHTNI